MKREDMKKIHLALATNSIEESIEDYTSRLGADPVVVVPNQYALWRTEEINLSIRKDDSCRPGELRHLGFEDSEVRAFTQTEDVNGVVWESFCAELQDQEITDIWPNAEFHSMSE